MKIKKVLVIFKTHLDIGFTDFSKNVTARYMEDFLPGAVRTAETLREMGTGIRFTWTTGSWLIYEYLCTHQGPEGEPVRRGLERGDISWHGLPFTTHTELMGPELFEYGLSLSRRLDERFGRRTIAAKMTDVPGHTRAIIPYMRKAGIEFLHIGVNPACTVPEVPAIFRWKSDSGEMLNVMYQKDYGTFSEIGDSGVAVYFAHTGDNLGIQSPEQIVSIFDALKKKMPEAQILAADLNDLAEAVREIEGDLPVLTEEIGDTWIHGIGSDPGKVSRFRGLERYLKELPEGEAKETLLKGLLMVPEHTWGLDVKTHLADWEHYRKEELALMRRQGENYRKMEASWREQRAYLEDAVAELPERYRERAGLIMKENRREALDCGGMTEIPAGRTVNLEDFLLRFNEQGELDYLEKDGRVLADEKHRLLSLCYEQFCTEDYKRFYSQYIRQDCDWARRDFAKPGMKEAVDHYERYAPVKGRVYAGGDKIAVFYEFPQRAWKEAGCPKCLDLLLWVEQGELRMDLAWFAKPANRIAEALWLGFRPVACRKRIRKLGQLIDPAKVVDKGQCRLHGTDYGVVWEELSIESLDAPLVAPQEPSLLNFRDDKPSEEDGVYFNLYNNVWGTNFPMWYDEDARFRFVLRTDRPKPKV